MEVTGNKLESENTSVLFCESCEVENLKTAANGVCRECKEYMCATCFRHHLKSKRTRHHVLLSLEEFSSLTLDCGFEDVMKCKKHDDEIIKFYCRSHDVVGCGDCIVLEHTSCKPEYIKDLAKTFKEKNVYKSIVKRVKDLVKKKSYYEQEIVKGKEKIEKMDEMALKEIREFRKEINMCLDVAEANLLSEMKKIRKENTCKQEKIENNLQSLTYELKKVAQMLNAQLHSGNALMINAVNCKSKLTDLESRYEITTKENAFKGFIFVRNKHISELLKAAEPLGSLEFCQIQLRIKKEFVVGSRVRRGPDWRYGNQDGGRPGTIIGFRSNGWVIVKWDTGQTFFRTVMDKKTHTISKSLYPIKSQRQTNQKKQQKKNKTKNRNHKYVLKNAVIWTNLYLNTGII